MVVELTTSNFEGIINQANKPAVIKFSAEWCGPCKMMKPVFESLAVEYSERVVFAEVDVDAAREIAIQHAVSSVPTFLFMKNGKVMHKEVGRIPESVIRQMVEDMLSA